MQPSVKPPSSASNALQQLALEMVDYARQKGASDSAIEVSEALGKTVNVRQGKVETIEYNRDKGLSVSVYLGQKRGNASTSDFSTRSMRDTVDAALNIARFTAEDNCAGLPDAHALSTGTCNLDLYHPWQISVEQAIQLAQECEQAAFSADKRIVNTEGASVSAHEANFIHANSLGFVGGFPTSRHSVSCSVIAGKGANMQRDYWYSVARNASEILKVEEIGRIAAERTVRRLKARKLATMQCPVLFEAPVATSLLGHFVHAVSGGSLYRKSSFLEGKLGQKVFSEAVKIEDNPTILRGLGSSAFDDEGVCTQHRTIVEAGVLGGYFLGSYSARKLGMQTTGNAGGPHNLILQSGVLDFAGLVRTMHRGLIVTELLGHGVNPVTGDYSRGAAGFWVENGEIQYPVEEITIAGNLREMFMNIIEVGYDVQVQGSRQSGSVLIDGMTIAGG